MDPYERFRDRYVLLFGEEPSDSDEIANMERNLNVVFPREFKEVGKFYRGGILGGISHHSIEMGGPASNIYDETRRIRTATKLPEQFVVLAEPPASLVVLDTKNGQVIWLDSLDVGRLGNLESLRNPQMWKSYSDFFSYLLEQEEEERGE